MSLTIVIPAYNEEESLPMVLSDLILFSKIHGFKIIVVNDGSTDNSKVIINSVADGLTVSAMHHKINRGYGRSLKSGILAVNTEYIITVDADGQHRKEDILNLYRKILETDADMIVGGRFDRNSSSIKRQIGKTIIRLFVRLMIKVSIYDINSGMKIYRTDLAKKYVRLAPDTMAFSDVISITFIYFGCQVIEIPITINKRASGRSTINYKTALETIKEILFIATVFAPYRFFSFLALLILGTTLAWGIPFIVAGKGFTSGTVSGILVSVVVWSIGVMAHLISGIRKDLILNS